MASADKYEQGFDPTMTEIGVIFAKHGLFARIVKNYEDLPNGKRRFYLEPNKVMMIRLQLKEKQKNDKSYYPVEDLYIKDIPKSHLILLDDHPITLKFLALCDWDLNFYDPTESKIQELTVLNKRLDAEKVSAVEQVYSLMRKISRMSKFDGMVRKEMVKQLAAEQDDINLLNKQLKGDEK